MVNENEINLRFTFRKYQHDTFPKVFKVKVGEKTALQIIYQDHMEWYWLDKSYYDCDGQKFDPYVELDMCLGAGGREVRSALVSETIVDTVEVVVDQ